MQTFLPYANFRESASVLDNKRLGKQRVENLQIMYALFVKSGWSNHPATKMWQGFEFALFLYQDAVIDEWVNVRGFTDNCRKRTGSIYFKYRDDADEDLPPWLGDEKFHLSHQSNLVRKLPEHYRYYFPEVPDNLPYIWPVM